MNKIFTLILMQVVFMSIAIQADANELKSKPAIVLVAFGTSVEPARKVFDHIDSRVRQRYPEHNLRWAFTSQFIIDKLKRRGVVTYNVDEVITQLRAEGFDRVVFQSLHIAPGQEYSKVQTANTSGLRVAFGDALMTSDEDIERTIDALRLHIDVLEPTVIAAHGNDKYPRFNERIEAFAARIEADYPRLVVASVEGSPGLGPLQKIKEMKPDRVNFVPLMIVAGDHILNDVLGDEDESWKHIIAAPQAEVSASLGWNDAVLDIYLDHLEAALQQVMQEGPVR
ncbi:sirohydrochlorin cobaltochelatase [Desulfuromonas sp. AOP6]|uniref:sirohydrochlorin cobaltochelatase n=1 Tax=Desulfuromonas sp. AOP6 TaxID=1566351 RepID=UPI001283BCE0|nr:sirohydrochlorin cobaltochelatase [Desulfuromonas sp. AOP6]BCA79018.1 sirohydrochlorin cobaltochelatase CbiKP [Desulfuromonas sp. AOP6]